MTTEKEKTIGEHIREIYQESRYNKSNFDINNKVDVLCTICLNYGHTPFQCPFQCHQEVIYDEPTLGQLWANNLNNDPYYPTQSNQNEDPFKEILNYLRKHDNKLNEHDTTFKEIRASIEQLQDTLDREERDYSINNNLNNLEEDNLGPKYNICYDSPPIVCEIKMLKRINELGEEELYFNDDCESMNDSIDSGYENDNFIENNDKETSPPIEFIPNSHITLSSNLPTHPISKPELNIEHDYLKQADINRELDELEELVFGHKVHIPLSDASNENISFDQDDINRELDELEKLIFGPKTHIPLSDTKNEEPKISDNELININTFIPNLQGALEIQRDVGIVKGSKHVRDPLRGEVIDFIIPIFRPKVDPRILKYVNQFSLCFYKLIYSIAKKKRFWLGNFPFWKKFGSLEFMPLKTIVYAAKECHQSLVELARANRR